MRHLKPLIVSGQIKTFEELFLYATKLDIAKAMKCDTAHIDTLINGAGKVYLKDVFNLCEAIGMETYKERGLIMDLWVE